MSAGGSGSQGSQPAGSQPAESEQQEGPRTHAGKGSGSFATAGEPQALAEVSGTGVVMTLRPTAEPSRQAATTSAASGASTASPLLVDAIIGDVHECSNGAAVATPTSQEVTLVDGVSPPVAFTLPNTPSPGANPAICYTLTIGGESRNGRAETQTGALTTNGPSVAPTGGPTGVPSGVSPKPESPTVETPNGGTP
ncbi:hypothetical protein ACFV1W_22310 [Kitasatospora sp. NPDC059648]|uniref:hypothetical protein n=1 Tax=Kitasatospora sp. NPDC059648 TaxID=3346894 RepID=UPI0036BE0334